MYFIRNLWAFERISQNFIIRKPFLLEVVNKREYIYIMHSPLLDNLKGLRKSPSLVINKMVKAIDMEVRKSISFYKCGYEKKALTLFFSQVQIYILLILLLLLLFFI